MPRSERAIHIFQFVAGTVTVLGVTFAIGASFRGANTTFNAVILFVVLFVISVIGGGSISLYYVRLLKWVIQHLHVTEDHRWLIAFGITAICDVLMVTLNRVAVMVLSVLSMIVICIVASGWDFDRSGTTEGFFIGFGKLLLINMISGLRLPSALCGAVVLLAIASKLTESVPQPTSGNADSSYPTTEV